MTALAKSIPISVSNGVDGFSHEVLASTKIYQAAALGFVLASGYVRPLEAGDLFAGFSKEEVDNSSGSSGDKRAPNYGTGRIRAKFASVARADVGSACYMSDDNTFTTTSTSNSRIGTIAGWIDSTHAWVDFEIAKGV